MFIPKQQPMLSPSYMMASDPFFGPPPIRGSVNGHHGRGQCGMADMFATMPPSFMSKPFNFQFN